MTVRETPLTFETFPVAATFDELDDLLDCMQNPEVPGFVMRDVPTEVEATYRQLMERAHRIGFVPMSNYRYLRESTDDDFELHMDYVPRPEGPVATLIHANYTECGHAVGTFLTPTEDRSNQPTKVVPDHVQQLLAEGKTDADLFEATAHRTELSPRSLLVFRGNGKRPLAHLFETVGPSARITHVRQLGITTTRYSQLLQHSFDTAYAS